MGSRRRYTRWLEPEKPAAPDTDSDTNTDTNTNTDTDTDTDSNTDADTDSDPDTDPHSNIYVRLLCFSDRFDRRFGDACEPLGSPNRIGQDDIDPKW